MKEFPKPKFQTKNESKLIHHLYDKKSSEILPFIQKALRHYKTVNALDLEKEQIAQLTHKIEKEIGTNEPFLSSLIRAMLIAEICTS